MDAYHDKPTNGALWGSDRLDLGDVVIDLGIRYDYFNSNALFSNTPGFTFSDPNWTQSLNSTSSDAAYQAAVAKVFTPRRRAQRDQPPYRGVVPDHRSDRLPSVLLAPGAVA